MDHSANHRSLWQELDALVLAEFDALDPASSPVIALPEKPPLEDVGEQADDGAEAVADEDVQPRNMQMFDGEEQEVIARTSAWLRDRPNKDMIIDALWSAASDAGEPVTDESAAATAESEPA